MKKLWIIGAFFAIIGVLIYINQLPIIMRLLPIINAIRKPVAPNRPVVWSRGPDRSELPPGARPPNIIFIMTDDMGFNDISFTNGGAADGSLQTPNIVALAEGEVVFSNGYAGNAICAPSRACMMTGRYSTRFGFEYTPIFKIGPRIMELMEHGYDHPHKTIFHHDLVDQMKPIGELGMPTSEITIAEIMKQAGYHTAHIGKWHLGETNPMRPEDQGFDESLTMNGTYYLPENSPDVVNSKQDFDPIDRMVWAAGQYSVRFNGSDAFEPQGYLTDYYTDEAIKVIEANRHRPFFLYLAHWGIHNPLQAKKSDYDALSHIQDHRLRVYAAMIRAVDRSVGRVMQALRDNGLDEDTLVFFTSDNGGAGYLGLPHINRPYRGWKITLFEGGVHVPFFARWPKRFPAGSTYDRPVSHMDIFSTAAAVAGASLPTDRKIDGVNLLPYLSGENPGDPHKALFWGQGYYRGVLADGWQRTGSKRPAKTWLYHLAADPTEQVNLASRHPDKVRELTALLETHNAEQAEPLWPSVIEGPILIDKTSADRMLETDEYIYWPN